MTTGPTRRSLCFPLINVTATERGCCRRCTGWQRSGAHRASLFRARRPCLRRACLRARARRAGRRARLLSRTPRPSSKCSAISRTCAAAAPSGSCRWGCCRPPAPSASTPRPPLRAGQSGEKLSGPALAEALSRVQSRLIIQKVRRSRAPRRSLTRSRDPATVAATGPGAAVLRAVPLPRRATQSHRGVREGVSPGNQGAAAQGAGAPGKRAGGRHARSSARSRA